MGKILHIETTTNVCSVALSKDGKLLNQRENKEGKSHASLLTYYISQILSEEKLIPKDLDAISISQGPGSYTGLRIGVSTAKGLCYGAGLPLIAIHTLQILTQGMLLHLEEKNEKPDPETLFVPMLDARRMEVYSAVLDSQNNFVRSVKAEVISEKSFTDWLEEAPVYFFGNGAAKCREVIQHPNAHFIEGMDLSAAWQIPLAEKKLKEGEFEDVAYFEPFYLKDFIATTPRKNIL
jgi:tRNA threonylcarbamoyladenosine biosynthesis protein TsaB